MFWQVFDSFLQHHRDDGPIVGTLTETTQTILSSTSRQHCLQHPENIFINTQRTDNIFINTQTTLSSTPRQHFHQHPENIFINTQTTFSSTLRQHCLQHPDNTFINTQRTFSSTLSHSHNNVINIYEELTPIL